MNFKTPHKAWLYSIFLLLITFYACDKSNPSFQQDQINIIPKPSKIALQASSFRFDANTSISISDESQRMAAQYLADLFKKAANYNFKIENTSEELAVHFEKDASLKKEAYALEISPQQVLIKANSPAGYFYAVQTIRQLLPEMIESKASQNVAWLVPAVKIEDQPRFSWRGMHQDFSRHFFGMEEVKTMLDYMALYKLNTYHMHLTDDQGWRIEIKKYPLLTEKGAWRIESDHDIECKRRAKENPLFTIDEAHYHQIDGQKMYGGYFTQAQIKEIIQYAGARNITVIPEIDMPGHFKSAIDNYPYLSCTNETGWGEKFSRPACLGKTSTYNFVKDVLSEVADLFPASYIHIGGDEVNKKSWEACRHCQKKIKDLKLKDEHELQSTFNKEIADFLKTKGKKMIGWDEIVEGGLSPGMTVMWWRNWAPKMRYKAVDNGANLVFTPDFEYYFDFMNEATPLKKVYNYEPIPADFTATQKEKVLGVQANLWSEWIPNFKRLQFQAFPRMLGLAETGWTAANQKNYEDFQKRLFTQYKRLEELGIYYYIKPIEGLENDIVFTDKAAVTLKHSLADTDIYYTLDGSTPSKTSTKYEAPFEVTTSGMLKAIASRGNVLSEVQSTKIEKQVPREAVVQKPSSTGLKQWLTIDKFKKVEDIILPNSPNWKPVTSLKEAIPDKNAAIVWEGFFKAETDGVFTFETQPSRGILLSIGDKMLINNEKKRAKSKIGKIALKKGWHPIQIFYHQNKKEKNFRIEYVMPNGERHSLEKAVSF